jgi:glycosyltransferase involved in cell wall biosynthesis
VSSNRSFSADPAEECDKDVFDPIVSVILPTYGRPDLLAKALASVNLQTYTNIELIVADDNRESSMRDETKALINQANLRCPVEVIFTDGQVGGGRARNIAARHANGAYLAFLDDDDEFMPEKIEKQLEFMQSSQLDMSYQDVIWYGPNGRIAEYRTLNHAKGFDRRQLLTAHMMTPISPTSIYMLRRTLFEKVGGFGEVAVGQDWILMLRCIEAGAQIGYMPGAYVKQHLHAGERVSTGRAKIRGEHELYSLRKSYLEYLGWREKTYIRFRHHAVLAVAKWRSGYRVGACFSAITAIICSPRAAVREALKLNKGKKDKQAVGADS